MNEPLNLDAARAARSERQRKSPAIKLGKKTFTLPSEMPFRAVELISQVTDDPAAATTAILGMLRELLGDEQFERFMSLQPSAKDIELVMTYINESYGFESSGESGASAEQS